MKYLCFDIESCDGGSKASICSLGYVTLSQDLEVTAADDMLINPAVRFNPMLLSGKVKLSYPEKVFRAAPDFKARYAEICRLFACDAVLGFSVGNDIKYLNDACEFYDLPYIDFDFYDVQLVYSIYKGERRVYSLAAAAAQFGLQFTAHRSSEDALVTARILQNICKETNCKVEELFCRYGLTRGRNEQGLVRKSVSSLPIALADLGSKSMKRRLLSEFVRFFPFDRQSDELKDLKVCFDEELELDIDLSRAMIYKLVCHGGKYTPSVAECRYFVSCGNADSPRLKQALRRKKTMLSLAEFSEKIGGYQTLAIDDRKVLAERELRLQREKNAAIPLRHKPK